jgi:ribosomal protein S27AE
MGNHVNPERDWYASLMSRLRKPCPRCSNSLLTNHLIYDLGYRKCLYCKSRIETFLPSVANYLLIAGSISGVMTENLLWKIPSCLWVCAWGLRRFKLSTGSP